MPAPYQFNEQQIENFKKRNKDVAAERKAQAERTGVYYRLMLEHIRKVLGDIKAVYPAYDAKAGYELAGFVWFQGWNDMVDGGTYPTRGQPGSYDAYSKNLAHFIRDVRKDLKAPKLPFVIGVMGAGGPIAKYGPDQKRYAGIHGEFRKAMAAPSLSCLSSRATSRRCSRRIIGMGSFPNWLIAVAKSMPSAVIFGQGSIAHP